MIKKIKKPSKVQEMSFQRIENSLVILYKDGLYTQHEAYTRRGEVFAKHGNGYIGLRQHGTSKPGYTLLDYDLGSEDLYSYTELGRIVLRDHPQAKEDCESTLQYPGK